jgi:aminopeptidase
VLLGLPGDYDAVAVTGLGLQGRGHNELEELHEGLENVRSAAAGTLAVAKAPDLSDVGA